MGPLPVIIIGTGCSGLTLANGLKNAGIPYLIFERDTSVDMRPRDWNMGMHWGGDTLAECYANISSPPKPLVCSVLKPLQSDPFSTTPAEDRLRFLNGATGELLFAPPAPYFFRVKRSSIRRALSANVDVQYGKTFVNMSFGEDAGRKTVTAHFEDGSSATGCLIVGADGGRSAVRKALLPPLAAAPTRLPYSFCYVQAKYTREQALFLRSFHPLYLAAAHPVGGCAFLAMHDVPDPGKPEAWTFSSSLTWPCSLEEQDKEASSEEDRLERLRELGKLYTEPWKSAIAWLNGDEQMWHSSMSVWDPSTDDHAWDNHEGRVTLAGDAAHVMTFQRGQGLNHALDDAGKILESIKAFSSPARNVTQADAIAAYEAEMKSRAGEEVRLSAMNTAMLHSWEKVLKSPALQSGIEKVAKTETYRNDAKETRQNTGERVATAERFDIRQSTVAVGY